MPCVAGAPPTPPSPLDIVASLVDQSLVWREDQPDGEPWLRLPETMREYAQEQLAATGEVDEVRAAHAAYYCDLAERAEPELSGPRQHDWLDRLEREPLGAAWALLAHRRRGTGIVPLVIVSQIVLYVALDGPLFRYRLPLLPSIVLLGAAVLALVLDQIALPWQQLRRAETAEDLAPASMPAEPCLPAPRA